MPVTITLNDYQIANLKAAIEAWGYGTYSQTTPLRLSRSPLTVLNNGDWIGEIYLMLPDVDYKPNKSIEQLIKEAKEWEEKSW